MLLPSPLYGFIARMPNDKFASEVVRQALQDDFLCSDALYWIASFRAMVFIPVLSKLLFEEGSIPPDMRWCALEVLLELGYDFHSHEEILLEWANDTPVFEDLTPVVASVVLLRLGYPGSEALVSRFLRLRDDILLPVLLRIFKGYVPASLMTEETVRLIVELHPCEESLLTLFTALEYLLMAPLSDEVLRSVCETMERWYSVLGRDRLKEKLRWFLTGYLTREGYPIRGEVLRLLGEDFQFEGEELRIRTEESPDPHNVSFVVDCIRRLLESDG